MIIPDDKVLSYLQHRVGERKLESSPWHYSVKALEGNTHGKQFLDTFGNSTIMAYIGFVDLYGFSKWSSGKSPEDIASHVLPFLQRIIREVCSKGALVDKMLGDEIMFILSDPDEGGTIPAILQLGRMMGSLYKYAYEESNQYKFRFAISHGEVFVAHLSSAHYSEWSVLGRVVNVAKRLESLTEIQEPDPVCGAIGISMDNWTRNELEKRLYKILENVVGIGSQFTYRMSETPRPLPGLGDVLFASIIPRDNEDS